MSRRIRWTFFLIHFGSRLLHVFFFFVGCPNCSYESECCCAPASNPVTVRKVKTVTKAKTLTVVKRITATATLGAGARARLARRQDLEVEESSLDVEARTEEEAPSAAIELAETEDFGSTETIELEPMDLVNVTDSHLLESRQLRHLCVTCPSNVKLVKTSGSGVSYCCNRAYDVSFFLNCFQASNPFLLFYFSPQNGHHYANFHEVFNKNQDRYQQDDENRQCSQDNLRCS